MKRISLLFVLWFIMLPLCAQTNRYIVKFANKEDSPYSISRPTEFLSNKAIERRQNQSITLTIQDLPVNPAYIEALIDLSVDVYFTSKWMNAALIQTSEDRISNIEELGFVKEVELVAPGERLSSRVGDVLRDEPDDISGSRTETQLKMLGIDQLHRNGFDGKGITMAFFDSGFPEVDKIEAFSHIYNDDRLKYALNLVENDANIYQYDDHGTRVFSIVSGKIDGEFKGAAPSADFMLFVTEDVGSEYRIEEYNWLFAAEMADSAGVDIISSSVGYNTFDDPDMDYVKSELDGNTPIVTKAADWAASKGILVVTSAGNEGSRSWKTITAPADADSILAVGSVTPLGFLSSFSSTGPTADGRIKPEVVAQGSSTALIRQSGNISSGSGTSFSAPLIAGMAACLWQANKTLSNMELRELIIELSDTFQSPDNQFGYGVPDYRNSLVLQTIDLAETPIQIFPNPFNDQVSISLCDIEKEETFNVNLVSFQGQPLLNELIEFSPIFHTRSIQLSNLSSGMYVLTLSNDSISRRFKIIKY